MGKGLNTGQKQSGNTG